jgi:phosphoribosylanthranilate isomerase
VKICGLTRREDALEAAAAGADFLGVVSVPESPRFRTPQEARALAEGIDRPLVIVVADLTLGESVEAAGVSGAAVVQLHGREPPELVEILGKEGPWEVWKALRIQGPEDLKTGLDLYGEKAIGLLLDAWHPHRKGGTGVPFSWSDLADLRDAVPERILLGLAGGLSPENVSEAISCLRPNLVDVSSGVEGNPGQKNHARIRAFLEQVRGHGEE